MSASTLSRSRRLPRVISLAMLSLVASCFRPDPAVGDCGALLQLHRSEHERQVTEEFNTYPLELRYRYYICGRQAAHAPWSLGWEFAEGGEEAARFLQRK